ncbi:catabolite control protein A [Apilactobacillus kunkeei]|uniref:Catabolite control protein A n=1 Tax=Apilactobacillus kunkeei DSM 12361 = ATCC 700308 TaxID=1423768 RepID=A0A0R1FTW1_9LACO|nr:catabolite control protein A [Apilactobacillus kunkeei]KOY73334.1 Catabolite control protein A [Apilactobacillus kunkeei DSM 12361 = ATCC 700308]KRK25263.1 catabolite control protein A [Apilactobacillus kunkeei DSM 12361 = ATCC 700308]MCK8620319.1 catabolite control protein A [Apilactobacillus kunkeei]MCK8626359.1 catabolite control protein A [Apilactobacillus kunkeei]MCK8635383.1 catabolite control protein A [Apilactobacillus kunkeei]
MEKQNVTIYDVARESGVSMATVSRVLNGNSNVRQATKEKVLKVIDDLDYRPNAVARGLASKKTTTVGVIIPDVTDGYFSSLARGIDDIATMYKYNIILANSDDNPDKEASVLNTLLSKQVDGIIFMGNEINDDLRADFKRSDCPIVLAGSVDINNSVPSVNIDYADAVKNETERLIKNGNSRIAFASGSMKQDVNKKYRLKGYVSALENNGIKFNEKLVFETKGTYEDGYDLAEQIINDKVTAAVATNDELAAGILNGMTDRGVSVPQDFELFTSNNTKLAKMMRPQLSSITQPLYDIGAVAMRLLTKIMNKEEIDNRYVVLGYEIVERDSTK